jgi:hypothetical protein
LGADRNGKSGRIIEEFISAGAIRNSDAFDWNVSKNGYINRFLREDLEREIQSGSAFFEKVHQQIRG